MNEVLYHEEFGSGLAQLGLIVAAASIGVGVIEFVRGFPNDALGPLIGILGTIVGLSIWSVARYSRIRVTSDYLQVGRERLGRSDLDQAYGVRDAGALSDEERALLEYPFRIPSSAGVRVPGGAFGRIAGTGVVVLRSAGDGTRVAFSSRRPEELIYVLRRWILEN